VYFFSEKAGNDTGILLGIELLDFSDKRICKTGDTQGTYKNTEVK
jgi:hypothetical protein